MGLSSGLCDPHLPFRLLDPRWCCNFCEFLDSWVEFLKCSFILKQASAMLQQQAAAAIDGDLVLEGLHSVLEGICEDGHSVASSLTAGTGAQAPGRVDVPGDARQPTAAAVATPSLLTHARKLLTNRFHVTHYAGCAILFNKDTFYPNVDVKSMYLHDTRRDLPDQVMEGEQGWVLQGVLSRASFRRSPVSWQKYFTVLSLHISNSYAKKKGIAKKLILTLRRRRVQS